MSEGKQMGRPAKWPWRTMEVGDSFVIPSAGKPQDTAAGAANRRYAPRRFRSKRVEGGILVERVA